MSALIKFKRGAEQHIQEVILERGEPAFSINTHKLFVGDGERYGGHPIGMDPSSISFTRDFYDENFTSSAGQLYVVDTSSNVVTILFPESPSIGDQIRVIDAKQTFNINNVTCDPNGNRIDGSVSNFILDSIGAYIFMYGNDGVSDSWFCIPVSGEGWFRESVEDTWNYLWIDDDKTAEYGYSYLVDTLSGTIIITTPTDPNLGDKFQVIDAVNNFATNNCDVQSTDPVGCGVATNKLLSGNGDVYTFIFDVCEDGSYSWTAIAGADSANEVLTAESIFSSIDSKINLNNSSYVDPSISEAITSNNSNYVDVQIETAINNLIESAPGTLDTLEEIAAALGENPDFAEDVVMKTHIKTGTSTFTGNGTERTIAHTLGGVPLSVSVIPTVNPSGYLGEVWCRYDATNIYVGNSGSFVGAFNYFVIYYVIV